MRSKLFWLDDEQWSRIEPHLPSDVRGKKRVDDRRVISGILLRPRRQPHLRRHLTKGGTCALIGLDCEPEGT